MLTALSLSLLIVVLSTPHVVATPTSNAPMLLKSLRPELRGVQVSEWPMFAQNVPDLYAQPDLDLLDAIEEYLGKPVIKVVEPNTVLEGCAINEGLEALRSCPLARCLTFWIDPPEGVQVSRQPVIPDPLEVLDSTPWIFHGETATAQQCHLLVIGDMRLGILHGI